MKRWAHLLYRLGWQSKGWTWHQPQLAVTHHLRQALKALSDSDSSGETQGVNAQYPPELHPLHAHSHKVLERILTTLLMQVTGDVHLQAATPTTLRLAGMEVQLDPEDLLSGSSLRKIRGQLKKMGLDLSGQTALATQGAEHAMRLRLWAMMWLKHLETLALEGTDHLRVKVRKDDVVPVLALWDTLELIEAARSLYGVGRRFTVEVQASGLSVTSQKALQAYLTLPDGQARTPLAQMDFVDGLVGDADVVLFESDDLDDFEEATPLITLWEEMLTLTQELKPFVHEDLSTLETSREVLDFMFQRFFDHPTLKDEQVVSVQRLLNKESHLVLLPTGYGKSAIFQLAALLQPRTALVVSPLLALIRDQVDHLKRDGIIAVEAFTSQSWQHKDTIDDLFVQGNYRLVYCTPERLENKKFKKMLADVMRGGGISLIAVDEAHSASEWGHDFRPSYRNIKNIREFIEKQGDLALPLVALTATASPLVRLDILSMLGLPAKEELSVVQTRSSDRSELSFSVHLVTDASSPQARLLEFKKLWKDTLPDALSGLKLTEQNTLGEYQHGTVVFAPYASRSKSTQFWGNASCIAEYLEMEVLPEGMVGRYASTPPRLCPRCGSSMNHQDYGQRRCQNPKCMYVGANREFKTAEQDWEQQSMESQDRFLRNQLPVLVSTKGFGMGIDKSNIRLVAHIGMSGSLEAYYQEAGRAGRDHGHAHIALVAVPPAQPCAEMIERGDFARLEAQQGLPLPCLKRNPKNPSFMELQCPYGLKTLCDFGQQAMFIEENFSGLRQEQVKLQQVYQGLKDDGQVTASKTEYKDDALTARAVSRLQQLQVIQSYEKAGSTFKAKVAAFELEALLDAFERTVTIYDTLGNTFLARTHLQHLRRIPWKNLDEYVQAAGQALLELLYLTVRRMRVQSLVNLHRFTQLGPGECRRVFLRRTFEIATLDDYNCGFCDNCVGGVNFERCEAFTPRDLTAAEKLQAELDEVLAQYDPLRLGQYHQQMKTHNLGRSMVDFTEYQLEQRPNDLSILFINAAAYLISDVPDRALIAASRALQVMQLQDKTPRDWLDFVAAFGEDQGVFHQLFASESFPAAWRSETLHLLEDPELCTQLDQAWTLMQSVQTLSGIHQSCFPPRRALSTLRGWLDLVGR